MKKQIGLVGVAFFVLAGCSTGKSGNTESSTESMTSMVSSQEVASSQVESSSEALTSSVSSMEESVAEGEVTFLPQKSDMESGLTVETDPLLQEINKKIEEAGTVGLADDLAIQYTGFYIGEPENRKAVFIFVNRTDMTLKNIKIKISMGTTDNGMILNSEGYLLSEEEFGISEPNTAIPIYLAVPPENEQTLLDITDVSTVTNSIDDLQYEEVK